MWYLLTIFICSLIIIIVNVLACSVVYARGLLTLIISVISSVVGVVIIDGIFAFLIRQCMPKKWFSIDKKFFIASLKEKRFYEKLKIKAWKEIIPDLGFFAGFRKNKIVQPDSVEYVERYIVEANYGIVVHIAGMIAGFVLVFIFQPFGLWIGLPVAVVNCILNALPVISLRYNLTKLHVLYKFNKRKSKVA